MDEISVKSWYSITDVGLSINSDFSEDQWQELGRELARNARNLLWLIGDWLLAGERAGMLPRGKLDDASQAFGLSYGTLSTAASVARRFDESSRHRELSFDHHRAAMDCPELLDWAKETGASVKALREEKKQRKSVCSLTQATSATGVTGEVKWKFEVGDCLQLPYPDDHFDLVFCSPPYESQRSYSELEFDLSGDDYVQWAADCYMECLRVCRGLVAWVVEGQTSSFEYSYSPFMIGAEVKRRGGKLRKPVVFQRNGIPGTGGPDWLRNDWEPIICATKNGRLPWSDNTAMGEPPKQNQPRNATNRNKDGSRKDCVYVDPDICNPGNVIKGLVGYGGLGWEDSHKNEAPFPEWLATFFIKSFCPPGGIVLDPFSGSGTTVAMACRNGRNAVGIDKRTSQVWLGETRLMGLTVNQRKENQGLLL